MRCFLPFTLYGVRTVTLANELEIHTLAVNSPLEWRFVVALGMLEQHLRFFIIELLQSMNAILVTFNIVVVNGEHR